MYHTSYSSHILYTLHFSGLHKKCIHHWKIAIFSHLRFESKMKNRANRWVEREYKMIHGHCATHLIYAAAVYCITIYIFSCGIAFYYAFFCVCSILEFHRFPVVIFLNPILNIYELINCHGADIVQYKIWNLVWSTIVLNQVFISIWLASFNPFWTAWHRSEGANRQKFRGNLNLLKCTYVEMIQS